LDYSTAYNHHERLLGVMDGLYMNARLTKTRHHKLRKDVKLYVWEDEGLKRCPQWVKISLVQHCEHLSKNISEWQRWAYKGSDGKLYLSYTDLSKDDQNKVDLGEIEGHHYWLEETNKDIIVRGDDGILTITKTRRLTEFYY
jgi:hypothetical protein